MMTAVSPPSGDVIDAIRPDLEAFASLWSALRTNYEGTNITRTVARLLHMYQPEDGVLAYERLLRTLYVLLEDFDGNCLRLLVSMVPPPKGVTDGTVQEVFQRATGFVRLNAPIFHRKYVSIHKAIVAIRECVNSATNCPSSFLINALNSISDGGNGPLTDVSAVTEVEKTMNVLSAFVPPNTNQPQCSGNPDSETAKCSESVLVTAKNPVSTRTRQSSQVPNRLKRSEVSRNDIAANLHWKMDVQLCRRDIKDDYPAPQIMPQEAEVFRGFPSNEISNTQSHIQNINHFYGPANYGFAPSQAYVNFGRVGDQNSGTTCQSTNATSLGSSYSSKWFQAPCMMRKSAYQTASSNKDFYLKTAVNKYLRVPLSNFERFRQTECPYTSTPTYQTLYTNTQEYLQRKSNTVTSGLLERMQQPSDMEEELTRLEKVCNESDSDKSSNLSGDVSKTIVAGVTDLSLSVMQSSAESTSTLNKTVEDRQPLEVKHSYVQETKVDIEATNTNRGSVNNDTVKEFQEEVRRTQRAIQEDIYKMDVIHCEMDNRTIRDIQPLDSGDLLVGKKLKSCVHNFLRRAENEDTLDFPQFPPTRALNKVLKPTIVQHILPDVIAYENIVVAKCPTINETPKISDNAAESLTTPSSNKTHSTEESSTLKDEISKKNIRRKKLDPPTRPKSQRVAQKYPSYLQEAQLPQGLTLAKKTKSANDPRSGETTYELSRRCSTTVEPSQGSINLLRQATAMTELAAYKKQYYDTLLSIQRAKAAVANSLAISSVGNSVGFDPYYMSYLHQQHQLLQHQQHLLMRPRLPPAPPRMLHTSILNTHGSSNLWVRSGNWMHPQCSQFNMPQHTESLHPPSLYSSGFGKSKSGTKRRKLEEIVEKLKETESSGTG